MTTKIYKLTWNDFDVEIEVNDEFATDERMHEINDFWSGAEDRLAEADGNVLHAVLKMLAGTVLQVQVEYGYSIYGLREEFQSREGWPNLDTGEWGLRIISADIPTFEPHDIYLWVVP
jgi:hypothetical protein